MTPSHDHITSIPVRSTVIPIRIYHHSGPMNVLGDQFIEAMGGGGDAWFPETHRASARSLYPPVSPATRPPPYPYRPPPMTQASAPPMDDYDLRPYPTASQAQEPVQYNSQTPLLNTHQQMPPRPPVVPRLPPQVPQYQDYAGYQSRAQPQPVRLMYQPMYARRERRPSMCRLFLKNTLRLTVFHVLNAILGVVGFSILTSGVATAVGLLPLCCFGLLVFRVVLLIVNLIARLDVTLYNFIAPPDEHVFVQLPPQHLAVSGDRLAPSLASVSPLSLMALIYLMTIKFAISALSCIAVAVAVAVPVVCVLAISSDDGDDIKIELGEDNAITYGSDPAAFTVALVSIMIIGIALMHLVAKISQATTLFFCCEKFSNYGPIYLRSPPRAPYYDSSRSLSTATQAFSMHQAPIQPPQQQQSFTYGSSVVKTV